MASLRNKQKLAAVIRKTQNEHPWNGQSRYKSVLWFNEEYIAHVPEEIEDRVTKKLSQQFHRTWSRILGGLSKLHEFLLNPQIRMHSGTVPGTFRNTNVENQGKNKGRLPEWSPSWSRHLPQPDYTKILPRSWPRHGERSSRRDSLFSCMVTGVSEDIRNRLDMVTGATEHICNRHDMVTGVIEETHNGHDMVTGATKHIGSRHDKVTRGSEEIRNGHDMVTGVQKELRFCPHMVTVVQEEIPYCSPWISSGKQQKARSTNQQKFDGQNTPVTIEADQILLALQQLATNKNLPKSITTITEFRNRLNPSQRQCPHLMETQRKLNFKIRENRLEKPQLSDRRSQNKLLPLSQAWWYTRNLQKHHEPQQREIGRNSDCVL